MKFVLLSLLACVFTLSACTDRDPVSSKEPAVETEVAAKRISSGLTFSAPVAGLPESKGMADGMADDDGMAEEDDGMAEEDDGMAEEDDGMAEEDDGMAEEDDGDDDEGEDDGGDDDGGDDGTDDSTS